MAYRTISSVSGDLFQSIHNWRIACETTQLQRGALLRIVQEMIPQAIQVGGMYCVPCGVFDELVATFQAVNAGIDPDAGVKGEGNYGE